MKMTMILIISTMFLCQNVKAAVRCKQYDPNVCKQLPSYSFRNKPVQVSILNQEKNWLNIVGSADGQDLEKNDYTTLLYTCASRVSTLFWQTADMFEQDTQALANVEEQLYQALISDSTFCMISAVLLNCSEKQKTPICSVFKFIDKTSNEKILKLTRKLQDLVHDNFSDMYERIK